MCATSLGANIFDMAPGLVSLEVVPVGNPDNPGDVQENDSFGSVPYSFRIGKTEITNAQYTVFLNSVHRQWFDELRLWDEFMASSSSGGIIYTPSDPAGQKYQFKLGRGNNPVNYVSWYSAIRFANWLHNGAGVGSDTETGAYTLGPLDEFGRPIDGKGIVRNPAAKWFLPSEDEWYKAAYHKNDGVTGNYWKYPTSTDTMPYSDQSPGSDAPDLSNTANFNRNDDVNNNYNDGYAVTGVDPLLHGVNHLTDAAAYRMSQSPYGTFDQGGNVWEWTEQLFGTDKRWTRGGSWKSENGLAAWEASFVSARTEQVTTGFRVATVALPEPGTVTYGLLGAAFFCIVRRQRSRWGKKCFSK
jgi:formylglycine-generating enzyme required for sulfatase activity